MNNLESKIKEVIEINLESLTIVPDASLVASMVVELLDSHYKELLAIEKVYYMNRVYIDFVKERIGATGFVTELDLLELKELRKDDRLVT